MLRPPTLAATALAKVQLVTRGTGDPLDPLRDLLAARFPIVPVSSEQAAPPLSEQEVDDQRRRDTSERAALRVVNGADVVTDTHGRMPFPWYAQLRRRTFDGTRSAFLCGACVVHAWPAEGERPAGVWLVSAAHCLLASSEGRYAVNLYAGGQPPYSPVRALNEFLVAADGAATENPPWLEVPPDGLQIFVHPLYDTDSNAFDLAMIRAVLPAGVQLPAPLAVSVGRLRLPATEQPPQQCAVVGFGATSPGSGASHVLQYGAVRVQPPDVRQKITRNPFWDASQQVWATGPVDARGRAVDTCQGDSGGPLFSYEQELLGGGVGREAASSSAQFQGGVRREVQVLQAVTSWGGLNRCGEPEYPGVYVRVAPFVAPAAPEVASLLPADSPWRLGIRGMIDAMSPVPYAEPGDAAATRPLPPPLSVVPASVRDRKPEDGEAAAAQAEAGSPVSAAAWVVVGLIALVFVAAAAFGIASARKRSRPRRASAKVLVPSRRQRLRPST